MHKLYFPFSFLLTAHFLNAAEVQPLLDLVPPQATVLYGVNVPAALGSPFGQQVFKRILTNNPAFGRYDGTVGFDPKRDVREVLFVATSPVAGELFHYDVILARGTFKPDRFLTVANLTGSTVTQDHGVSVITPPASSLHTSFAFVDSSTAIVGPVAAIKAILQQRSSKAPAGALAQKGLATGASYDAWYATVTPFNRLLPQLTNGVGGAAFSPALGVIHETSGGIKFRSTDAVLAAEALTKSDSEALTGAAVLRAAMPLIRNPRSAALKKTQFSVAGATLKGTATLTGTEMERLFLRPAPPVSSSASDPQLRLKGAIQTRR